MLGRRNSEDSLKKFLANGKIVDGQHVERAEQLINELNGRTYNKEELPQSVWRYEEHYLHSLTIHTPGQRDPEYDRGNDIAIGWNKYKSRPLVIVILPDGRKLVADGQHLAIGECIKFGNVKMPCWVTDGKDEKHFAQIVQWLNEGTKPWTQSNLWDIADKHGEDPQKCKIKEAAEEEGFLITAKAKATNHLTFVATLKRVYEKDGEQGFKAALRFLKQCFGEQTGSNQAYCFEGCHYFLKHNIGTPGWNWDKVIEVLREVPFTSVKRQASQTRRRYKNPKSAFAHTLVTIYNENREGRSWKLKPVFPDDED